MHTTSLRTDFSILPLGETLPPLFDEVENVAFIEAMLDGSSCRLGPVDIALEAYRSVLQQGTQIARYEISPRTRRLLQVL